LQIGDLLTSVLKDDVFYCPYKRHHRQRYAIDTTYCFIREFSQSFHKGFIHLIRTSFKKSATTGNKQGVTWNMK
jgi:hypothetical protein